MRGTTPLKQERPESADRAATVPPDSGTSSVGCGPGRAWAGTDEAARASLPQFTLRAVSTGLVLGGVLAACNIYVGLKIGTVFGTSIAAALLAFGFWSAVRAIFPGRRDPLGILENNISQTACSAAASVASAGLVAAVPALTLLTGRRLPWPALSAWLVSVMLLGILVAASLRRQMIIADGLRFPAGTATATLLREVHTRGAEALARVWALLCAGVPAAGVKLCVEMGLLQPVAVPLRLSGGLHAGAFRVALDPSLFALGVGGLIGFRACCSLLIGAVVAYALVAPALVGAGYVGATARVPLAALPPEVVLPIPAAPGVVYDQGQRRLSCGGLLDPAGRDALLALSQDETYRAAVTALFASAQDLYDDVGPWLLWPGVTLMVAAGLVSLLCSWRSFAALARGWRGHSRTGAGTEDEGVVPRRWLVCGLVAAAALSVALQIGQFGIAWWAALLGLALAFPLAAVAARVTGETGVGVIGPLGKVSQLLLGALAPQSPATNLMGASVAGGAASQCADLLDDLKCGVLLGASARLQVLAQLCGAVVGALVGSAAYLLLVPDPVGMVPAQWPAPAAMTWKAVATVFTGGLAALPPGARSAIVAAGIVGAALPLVERWAPQRLRVWVPSAISLGLGFVVPASLTLAIFAGGLTALVAGRCFPHATQRFLVTICTGLIAGESLAGIGSAMQRVLWG